MKEYSKEKVSKLVSEISALIAFLLVFCASCCADMLNVILFSIAAMLFIIVAIVAMNFKYVQKFFVIFTLSIYQKLGSLSIFHDDNFKFCHDLRHKFSTDKEFCKYLSVKYDEYMERELNR